eukprot:3804881-Alexandrium_andersonii.AAC.1
MKATMQRQVTLYMEQHNIALLALQETRIATTSQFTSGEYLFVLFGNGTAKEYAGVGFVLSLKLRRAVNFVHNEGSRMA